MDIKIALTEKQRTFLQTIEATPVTFFGGARGGGKSFGLRNILLLRRFRYPNSVGVIFRKTYPELEANHIRPILAQFPMLRPYYNEAKKVLTLPNGSTLEFAYCESEKDLDRYQGREYHDLGIEEAGQWTEIMFQRLRGSNRSSNPNIKARAMLTGNPGSVGHKWLKRLFIEREFKENENPKDYAFVQSFVHDNPALMDSDPEYVKRLEAEPNEALRKAFLYGDWDIFAGQFFSEINRQVHFINPFPIPPHWNRFGAYDYGFNHPAAFGWFATDHDGNVFMYRELVRASQRIDQFAAAIKQFDDTAKLYPIVAGLDCWTTKHVSNDTTPPTIADDFKNHGVLFKRAVTDRVQGANQVRNYLAFQNLASGRTKPRLFIFNTCPITFECLTRMLHDPKRPEDVLKVDAVDGDPNSGDDAYDMLRYAMMNRPYLSNELKVQHPYGSKAFGDAEAKRMEEAAEEHFKQEAIAHKDRFGR